MKVRNATPQCHNHQILCYLDLRSTLLFVNLRITHFEIVHKTDVPRICYVQDRNARALEGTTIQVVAAILSLVQGHLKSHDTVEVVISCHFHVFDVALIFRVLRIEWYTHGFVLLYHFCGIDSRKNFIKCTKQNPIPKL